MSEGCSSVASALELLRNEITCSPTADPRTIVISTGRSYVDGERVEIFVRLAVDGQRAAVSDGGITLARRELYGLEQFTRPVENLWKEIVADHQLEWEHGRVFTRGPVETIHHMVNVVGDAVLSLDVLRNQTQAERNTFQKRLVAWLENDAEVTVRRDKRIVDRFDNEQTLTAVVESPRGDLLIQGAGGRVPGDVRRSAEHAWWIFSGLSEKTWPIERRLIVLERMDVGSATRRDNAARVVQRLSEQAYVGTFEAQLTLSRFLKDPSVLAARDLVTQIPGQTSYPSWRE